MATPEDVTSAIMRGLADLRSSLEEAAARFESEARKMGRAADADEVDEPEDHGCSTMAGDQLAGLIEMIRSDAMTVASQLADGLQEVVDELRVVLQGRSADGDGAAAPDDAQDRSPATTPTARVAVVGDNGAAKKSGSKQAQAKKSGSKKAQAKKSGSKKAGAKKAGAKKSGSKKAGSKKSGSKKATAKKSGSKKATAKKSGSKKAGAKKSGSKKAGAKKSGSKKAGAKKSASKKAQAKK